jgi:hypothetical protein
LWKAFIFLVFLNNLSMLSVCESVKSQLLLILLNSSLIDM